MTAPRWPLPPGDAPFAEVIGDPIAHSKSPVIHGDWLARCGITATYQRTHVRPDDLSDFLAERAREPRWRGCNVTIPHKVAVIDLVADPGGVRESIGAMNTIARGPDGALFGTNTDAGGFVAPIADRDWSGAPVAVVGTGGAALAVLFALARLGAGPVTLIARNPLKGAALLAKFGLRGTVLPIAAPVPPVALLVNASALGMTGQPPYAPDLDALPDDAVVYDIVYTPLETPLLRAARARSLECVDGLEMLIGQAALAFELFFGVAPPDDDEAAAQRLRAALLA